jgi:heme exporter protein B
MSAFRALWKKELLLEFRQKHALAGIAMYVLATVFVCYLSLERIESEQVWGGLMWITGLFTAFNAVQKTFQQEGGGTQLYLYSLTSPRKIMLAKSLYNALLVAVLNVVSLFFFLLFFGDEMLGKTDFYQLFSGLILGSSGLGITLTFVSGLSYKSGAGVGLVAILGFPVIIPLLITIVRFTTGAMIGLSWLENGLNLLVLLILNGSALLLSLLLFPYLWRE